MFPAYLEMYEVWRYNFLCCENEYEAWHICSFVFMVPTNSKAAADHCIEWTEREESRLHLLE